MNYLKVEHILDIPKGCARILDGKGNDGKYVLIIGVSDNQINLETHNIKESYYIDDVKEYVLGIKLEDYRQAEAYSIAFDKLAKKMKEE